MGSPFFEELTKHFERFEKDSSVLAVVIKAEGKSFTAGLDLMESGSLLRGGTRVEVKDELQKTILKCQEGMNTTERC